MIIGRTIGLVVGLYAALYRPFSNIALWLTRRWGLYYGPLSKPPQRRQGPDLHLLCLLVVTPSAIRPDRARIPDWWTASPIPMSLYIFLIYNIYYLCCLCIDFYDISALFGFWSVVYMRRSIYKFLNVLPFWYTAVAVSGKVWPVNWLATLDGWL